MASGRLSSSRAAARTTRSITRTPSIFHRSRNAKRARKHFPLMLPFTIGDQSRDLSCSKTSLQLSSSLRATDDASLWGDRRRFTHIENLFSYSLNFACIRGSPLAVFVLFRRYSLFLSIVRL